MRGYRELIAWQRAMDLVPEIYSLVKKLPGEERYALGDQMRRAAVSIPANIAEGQGRQYPAEFARFLSIALGSLSELDTLLLVAQRLTYLTSEEVESLAPLMIETRKLIYGLLQSKKSKK